jgi:hypothetical protein
MVLSDPLVGSNWTGINGGGAEEIGIAAIGSRCDGGGVEEVDIYIQKKTNLVETTATH